jgi:hypothetical protein
MVKELINAIYYDQNLSGRRSSNHSKFVINGKYLIHVICDKAQENLLILPFVL